MPARNYSNRTLKLLWGRSAGRCAIPECRTELFAEATEYDPVVVIGEVAHIAALQEQGPRAEPVMTATERNDYDNLILLCQNCHALIDGQPGTYSIARLKEVKSAHELWVRASLPERGRSSTGWMALSLQGDHPTDLTTVATAISPDFIKEDVQVLKVPSEVTDWDAVGSSIANLTARLLADADPYDFRLAVFPLAPVSACIALGFFLTNRPHVRLFQFHRDEHTWAWPKRDPLGPDITVDGLDTYDHSSREVAFVFHLSANIAYAAIAASPAICRLVNLRVAQPGTGWLQHQDQLKTLAALTRQCFERAQELFPKAERWHLFFAGPAPAAVAVGQQINPTMCPPVHLYEFRARDDPPYRVSLCLGEK